MPTLDQILAGIRTARELIEQYDQVRDTLSEGDQAVVERELKQLQDANDAQFRRLDAKLDEASKR